jgi:DNA-binding PadR family transcriptional regulator
MYKQLSPVRLILLGFLAHQPMSGYDLKKRASDSIGHFWDLNYPQIYPELKKMITEGLITVYEEKTARGSRLVHSLTVVGRERLKACLGRSVNEEIKEDRFRSERLLRLFFAGNNPDAVSHILDNAEKEYNEKTALFEHYEKSLKGVMEESPDHKNFLLTVLFGLHYYRGCLDWVGEARKLYKGDA